MIVNIESRVQRLNNKASLYPIDGHDNKPRGRDRTLSELIENLNDSLWAIDKDGYTMYMSRRMAKTMGYTPGEILYKHISSLTNKHGVTAVTKYLECEKPRVLKRKFSISTKDGKTIQLNLNVSRLVDTDDKCIGASFSMLDAIEQRKTEQALKYSEKTYKSIFDNVPASIFFLNRNGDIVNVNPFHLNHVAKGRLSLEDYIGKKITTHPTIINAGLCEPCARLLSGEAFDLRDVYFPVTSYGTSGYFNVKGVPILGKDGLLIGAIIMKENITDRKLVEDSLRDSLEFNSLLIDSSPNPVLVVKPDTTISYVNSALVNATGFSSQELIGKKAPYPWWTGENSIKDRTSFRKVLRSSGENIELFKRNDGQYFWVQMTATAVRLHGKVDCYLITWVDTTDQMKHRKNMETYITQVIRAQEDERKRIARELHDDAIQLLTDLNRDITTLARYEGPLPKQVKFRLVEFSKQVGKIEDEIRRYTQELRPDILEHLGLIAALKVLTSDLQKLTGLDIDLKIVGSPYRTSRETELALFRVVQEAFSNIRKHSQATKGMLRIEFTTERVVIFIVDNGIGFELPEEVSSFADTGRLGLTGMSERLRLIGGRLSIKTMLGKGTRIVASSKA